MLVSAVQMDVRTQRFEENLETAYRHIREAVRRGSALVLLPEMFTTGFAYPDLEELARATYDESCRFMSRVAREGKIWLVGSIPEPGAGGGVYNTLMWYSPQGKLAGAYRKAHLFSPTREDAYFIPGDEVKAVGIDGAVTGGLICFDIRFPEMARSLALQGAQILLVAAQFPHPRAMHWETLLKARAIENQVWVVAANRIGKSGELEYFGRSMIVDPWGEVAAAEMAEKEAVVTERIDLGMIERVRAILPCRRRPDLYGDLAGTPAAGPQQGQSG
ncbi:MAG: carbon-nitrogen hydrolase [Firmicutes bacterium]|nr:carbon-nitrogen hydrolase [Bacillota bacterium]MBO2521074.1 carbon-nitrogen hydrolase [Bacillota bacterium]